jgi:putative SOS response-associated peptidase YedK
MPSQYRRTRPWAQRASLSLHPDHCTTEEAAKKLGMLVQTTVPIFEVPPGTRGPVVPAAQTHADGYAVAMAWQLVPAWAQEYDHARDADTTPPSDPLINWLTKSAYGRYVIEITTEGA